MSSYSYGSLKTPPTHPAHKKFNSAESIREDRLDQIAENLSFEDHEFLYSRRKQSVQKDILLAHFLVLIRKFDFMPIPHIRRSFNLAIGQIEKPSLQEEV